MKQEISKLKTGHSVAVKDSVLDPELGVPIGGYQGRILAVGEEEDGPTCVCIQWDSITLRSMPFSFIEKVEENGLDWSSLYLQAEDVEPAGERDTQAQVRKAARDVYHKTIWIRLGEEGTRIQQVLEGVDRSKIMACLRAWKKHLGKNLSFPFRAKMAESQYGDLQVGDKVTVTRFSLVDDMYGLIMDVLHKRGEYSLPLCDLEVSDKKSSNYQLVGDYGVWFANK